MCLQVLLILVKIYCSAVYKYYLCRIIILNCYGIIHIHNIFIYNIVLACSSCEALVYLLKKKTHNKRAYKYCGYQSKCIAQLSVNFPCIGYDLYFIPTVLLVPIYNVYTTRYTNNFYLSSYLIVVILLCPRTLR